MSTLSKIELRYAGDAGDELLRHDADALRSLAQHPGWGVFVDVVRAMREQQVKMLLMGQLKQHADYAHKAGTANALDMALEAPAQVLAYAQQREDRAKAAAGGEEG